VAGGPGAVSASTAFFGILWNVITVSLRQTIIPATCSGG
jgi:hypothetical protein